MILQAKLTKPNMSEFIGRKCMFQSKLHGMLWGTIADATSEQFEIMTTIKGTNEMFFANFDKVKVFSK